MEYSGVTVIVATTGVVPLFTTMKEAILPVPEAARPILVVLFVHLNTAVLGAPVKLTAAGEKPLKRTLLDHEKLNVWLQLHA